SPRQGCGGRNGEARAQKRTSIHCQPPTRGKKNRANMPGRMVLREEFVAQLDSADATRTGACFIGAQVILSSINTHLSLPLRLKSTRCLPFCMVTRRVSSAKAVALDKAAATIRVARILFMLCSSRFVSCWRNFTFGGEGGAVKSCRGSVSLI